MVIGDWNVNEVQAADRSELEASPGATDWSYLVLELPIAVLVLLHINVLKNKLHVRSRLGGEQAISKT